MPGEKGEISRAAPAFRRLAFLGVVNGVILLHVLAYYGLGRREVGCVDFFGLATFAGKGQITAGTIFLAGLFLLTLLLGRVFCGWGCHFAFFQDLLARVLELVDFQVPFRRSRAELIIPHGGTMLGLYRTIPVRALLIEDVNRA